MGVGWSQVPLMAVELGFSSAGHTVPVSLTGKDGSSNYTVLHGLSSISVHSAY